MNRTHIGQNLQKVRVYLGVKQDALANDLGITQQEVSKIEKQEYIEEHLLLDIADVLSVSPEVIMNFNLERAIANICKSDYESSILAKEVEPEDEIQIKMLDKIFELYERLLKSEKEKIEILTLNNNK